MNQLFKKTTRSGHSIAVIIPASICHALQIGKGTELCFRIDEEKRLIVTPAVHSANYTLKELLAQCAPRSDGMLGEAI